MKKFKYKLDALLKLREFKEKKIQLELASILNDIKKLEDRNIEVDLEIDQAYKEQEEMLKNDADPTSLQFFPVYIRGKRAEKEQNKVEISNLYVKYKEKIVEMKTAMGEVKIIENLKEEAKKSHQKELNKELQKEADDFNIMKIIREKINSGEI